MIEDGVFSPTLITHELRTDKSELAETLGLNQEFLSREKRIRSTKIEMLLRQMLEILCRVEKRTGSMLVAYYWYRGERLLGFGDATAERLVKEGKASYVRA